MAQGAAEACRAHFPNSSGSLIIRPAIKSEAHWAGEIEPFSIGDLDPSGSFVHIFDEVALDVILGELDTVRDFTDYLEKRAAFIRSDRLLEAHGEENLLALYAINVNGDGDHDFVSDKKQQPISIDRSRYQSYIEAPEYSAKKHAEEISYLWDGLVETFTTPMLDGTSITPEGHEFDLRKFESGVRHMALQRRYIRRNLGRGISEALEKGKRTDRFFRLMMGSPGSEDSETAFFLVTLKYLNWMEEKGGYETYRLSRSNQAHIYAKAILEQYSHLNQVIGIACEPPDQGRGGSEDLIYAEQHEWSDDDRKTIKEDCKTIGIFQNKLKSTRWTEEEFPAVETITFAQSARPTPRTGINRKNRRATIAAARKRKN